MQDPANIVAAENWSRPDATGESLRGSGLIVVNPPFTLAADAQILLPALAQARSGRTNAATVRIDNLRRVGTPQSPFQSRGIGLY